MNTTDPTNSRKTFYAAAAIFDSDVSASAKLVLLYLSRVSNREGVCFPSLATIGEHCGYSKNTVRKALAELEQAGLLTMERGYQTTHNGRTRCTCNTYTILTPTKERCPTAAAEPEGVQPVHGEGAAVERERIDIKIRCKKNGIIDRRKEGDRPQTCTILKRVSA